VIAIAFDGYQEELDFYLSHRRIFKFELMQDILKLGCFRVSETKEQFLGCLNACLKDPTQDASGREACRRELLYQVDGNSARRIAKEVLKRLPDVQSSQSRLQKIPA
jgi:(2Fe-2S) ferredoxin